MKNFLFLIFASILAICITAEARKSTGKAKLKGGDMKIRITFNNAEFTATMYDNPTARDFISLLPLTLELKDYAGTEKISQIPRKLSLKDAPSGSDPSIGDITYYSPWGNIAVFYRDFGYADGLIILGKIDSDMKYFEKWEGAKTVKIELISPD